MTTRQKFREMVVYLLKGKFVEDDEVIEGYTDSLMLGAEEYHKHKLASDGVSADVSGFSEDSGDGYVECLQCGNIDHKKNMKNYC